MLSGQKDDPLDDQQEFVSLPDMNEGQSDDYIYRGDSTLWVDNNISDESEVAIQSAEDFIPNNSPIDQNQMSDPQVFSAYSNWFNSLD